MGVGVLLLVVVVVVVGVVAVAVVAVEGTPVVTVPLALEAVDAVNEVVVLVELELVPLPLSWYTLRRDPAPQNSVPLSLHTMLQSVIGAGTAPAAKELPHQHSPPYSRPA